ncbi:glycosyltransferase family 2 protein [Bacillus paralicheniformis]|uniref:glycosyltransferase family 2 protein n=1 Tax=Bacillus TaxID=1386 RepID=UPI0004173F5A|nr:MULTISPECIES: glycosyltransferase family 2 protein [Bacillus]MCU4670345.1 glycosyltransferase [Bacillus paralicheniformis]MDW6055066.1 glycosyltransferase family 2 protein [Bacillus paralicheniformis]MEC1822991.1 glycosyltransferase family 2 protein [Bacillus paralicheniformis]MED1066276.1 glycosyltransferase family 2 protein [Bacillus paralicheniformis]MED1219342.1 glycosyltransferase family 2 protein [Bacillus paralicheniformis]
MFSIIMPIYNSENYLRDSIESVINQSIGFKENIELILIDDGSVDSSPQICEFFKDLYPNNIKILRIENSGPSAARNCGLSNVSEKSKFIGFLDSDDTFSQNALQSVYNFFCDSEDVNIAVLPVYYTGKKEGGHKLNNRFEKGTRVINILNDYKAIHFYIGGTFYRKHILNSTAKFDETIKFWEDAIFFNQLLLKEKRYGAVAEGKYYYRKRKEKNSLVDRSWFNKKRYTYLLNTCYMTLLRDSIKQYDIVLPYLQFLIVYHMKLFLYQNYRDIYKSVLDQQEQKKFVDDFIKILRYIKPQIIKEQNMPMYYKEFMYHLLEANTEALENIKKERVLQSSCTITSTKIKGFKLELTGHFINQYYEMQENDEIYIRYFNRLKKCKREELKKTIEVWGYKLRDFRYAGFVVEIPIWAFAFDFVLKTPNDVLELNHVNIFKSLLTRVFKKR